MAGFCGLNIFLQNRIENIKPSFFLIFIKSRSLVEAFMSAFERLRKILEVSKDLTDSSELDPDALLSSSINNTPQDSQEIESSNNEHLVQEESQKPPLIPYSSFVFLKKYYYLEIK